MAQDLDNALNKLQTMLATDEGKKDLEGMLGSFSGNTQESNQVNPIQQTGGFGGGLNLDIISKMKTIMDELQSGGDSRSNLLNALKPYLSQTRHSHVDSAIKIMGLGKLPNVIKSMRK